MRTFVGSRSTPEDAGNDCSSVWDHYPTMGGDGLPGPSDAWVPLAGLALQTSTIRLGTLVTSATFRLRGPLAISVAQVDGHERPMIDSTSWESDHRRVRETAVPLIAR